MIGLVINVIVKKIIINKNLKYNLKKKHILWDTDKIMGRSNLLHIDIITN